MTSDDDADACLICGGPTTDHGACVRTLRALRDERGGA